MVPQAVTHALQAVADPHVKEIGDISPSWTCANQHCLPMRQACSLTPGGPQTVRAFSCDCSTGQLTLSPLVTQTVDQSLENIDCRDLTMILYVVRHFNID